MYEGQAVCHFCGARHLFIAREGTRPGMTNRTECYDCGWITQHEVTVVYHPDLYDLADPYGAGIDVHSRCIDCGHTYYSHMDRPCYQCGGVRFTEHVVKTPFFEDGAAP